jgi:hypothetical protein
MDERPLWLTQADQFIKDTDESIKDDMLYWIATNHYQVFCEASKAAL